MKQIEYLPSLTWYLIQLKTVCSLVTKMIEHFGFLILQLQIHKKGYEKINLYNLSGDTYSSCFCLTAFGLAGAFSPIRL